MSCKAFVIEPYGTGLNKDVEPGRWIVFVDDENRVWSLLEKDLALVDKRQKKGITIMSKDNRGTVKFVKGLRERQNSFFFLSRLNVSLAGARECKVTLSKNEKCLLDRQYGNRRISQSYTHLFFLAIPFQPFE